MKKIRNILASLILGTGLLYGSLALAPVSLVGTAKASHGYWGGRCFSHHRYYPYHYGYGFNRIGYGYGLYNRCGYGCNFNRGYIWNRGFNGNDVDVDVDVDVD